MMVLFVIGVDQNSNEQYFFLKIYLFNNNNRLNKNSEAQIACKIKTNYIRAESEAEMK